MKWLRKLLQAVKRWLRGSSNSSMSATPKRSFRNSTRRLQRWRKWAVDNPSNPWPGVERLALLKDLLQHKGWEVYKELLELEIDRESQRILNILPQDETNFKRGLIQGYMMSLGMIELTLQRVEAKKANDESGKRNVSARDRGNRVPKSAFWGSPNFYG